MKDFKITHLGEILFLHPYKSVYWLRHKILFIADLHLGKATHFRKSGIPIPEIIHQTDLDRIEVLINAYKPQRVFILGDLFHSSYNTSWAKFQDFCLNKIDIKPELVLGNHDILENNQYDFLSIYHNKIDLAPFVLSHKPILKDELNGLYNLCGHVHPSIKVHGTARQSLKVECFYFGKNHGILPAFGNFTGSAKMPRRHKTDKVFAITNQKIIHLF